MRAAELSRLLAQSVDSFVAYLLPNGERHGSEWEVGSVGGEHGHSLRVHLSGPKAGVWKDFASDEGGDLLDLIVANRGLSMPEAMDFARDWLGVQRVEFYRQREPRAVVKAPQGSKPATGSVQGWLTGTRHLKPEAIKAYRVAEKNGEALFPSFTPDGEHLQFIKYRAIDAKRFHAEVGGISCLFGWQAIPDDAREVVITEGEIDAVSWWPYPALSVTNGAGSLEWIENEYERLERFDTIYIAFDMDNAGQKHIEEVVGRLGRERCRVVELPEKDSNECLKKGIELEPLLKQAKSLDPPELRKPSAYRREAIEIAKGGTMKTGVTLPQWKGADGFAFGPSELTVIAGPTGSGKSEVVDLITLFAMRQGERACVASLEFHPAKWLTRVARQAVAAVPDEDAVNAAIDWLDERCVLYGKRGTVKADRLIEVFRYAARRYGCTWFVVDNLAKCGISEDDYPAQKDLSDKLGDFANEERAHVILVCHTRKEFGDGVTSIKGSGGIADMADNVAILWRNRKQEEKREEAKQFGVSDPSEFNEPDAWLRFKKVRDGEHEPRIPLWWSPKAHQHVPWSGCLPVQFVKVQHAKAA